MNRLLAIIAATAAAAAVAAAISLPAGADDAPPPTKSESAEVAAFASCLRTHGLAVPEGADPVALKTWIGAHEDSADVQAALKACQPESDQSPEKLVACLHDHGLDAPSKIEELKPWVAEQDGTAAGRAALEACGINARPVDKAPGGVEKAPGGGGGCAGDKAAEKAKLTRVHPADAAKPKVAPAPAE